MLKDIYLIHYQNFTIAAGKLNIDDGSNGIKNKVSQLENNYEQVKRRRGKKSKTQNAGSKSRKNKNKKKKKGKKKDKKKKKGKKKEKKPNGKPQGK